LSTNYTKSPKNRALYLYFILSFLCFHLLLTTFWQQKTTL